MIWLRFTNLLIASTFSLSSNVIAEGIETSGASSSAASAVAQNRNQSLWDCQSNLRSERSIQFEPRIDMVLTKTRSGSMGSGPYLAAPMSSPDLGFYLFSKKKTLNVDTSSIVKGPNLNKNISLESPPIAKNFVLEFQGSEVFAPITYQTVGEAKITSFPFFNPREVKKDPDRLTAQPDDSPDALKAFRYQVDLNFKQTLEKLNSESFGEYTNQKEKAGAFVALAYCQCKPHTSLFLKDLLKFAAKAPKGFVRKMQEEILRVCPPPIG